MLFLNGNPDGSPSLRAGWGFGAVSESRSVVGQDFGALSGLVQGSQQVTTLKEVQVPLQRDVDLAVVAGQLRQTGGIEGRTQQTARYSCKREVQLFY